MSLGKKDIIRNIYSKAHLSLSESSEFLEKYLKLIKTNKSKKITISNFGVFYPHNTPKRIGRNPLTGKSYTITKRKLIKFRPSNKIKKIIN